MQQNRPCPDVEICGAPLELPGPNGAVESTLGVFAHREHVSRHSADRQRKIASVREAQTSKVWEERAWLVLAGTGLATLVLSFWLA